jgi:hypothetical protein
MAKGAEITAYEVAKAGLSTAIGTAIAALRVAGLAVEALGHLAPGLLELVNGTIRAATKLLFLRRAEVLAELYPTHQAFSAALSFTALGKDYDFRESFDIRQLNAGFLDVLTQRLRQFLQDDLDAVAKGHPLKAAAPGALRVEAQPEAMPDIKQAAEKIACVSQILDLLQTRYRETFGEDLSEFTTINANFSVALQTSHNALTIAKEAINAEAFGNLRAHVRSNVDKIDRAEQDRRRGLEEALRNLTDCLAQSVYVDSADEAMGAARLATTARAATRPLASERPMEERPAGEPSDQDQRMIGFLRKMEDTILESHMPADTSYIDLSREPAMHDYFRETFEKLGAKLTPDRKDQLAKFGAEAPLTITIPNTTDDRRYHPRFQPTKN